MTPRQVTSRRPPGYFEGSTSTFTALALLVVLALVGLGLGFTRPLLREAPLSGAFDQSGTFSYSATPKMPTPVYPSGSVLTSNPIYPGLVNNVVLRYAYRFTSALPHHVKGTIELRALLLSQSDTWQQLTVIKVATAFEGDIASVVSSLPLKGLYSLIDTVSAQSGVAGAAYVADVQPVVRITGEVGGRAIHESFAPVLPFTVAPTVITLNDAAPAAPPGATYIAPSATSELAATLHPNQSGSVDHLVTNVASIARYAVDVSLLRVVGMIFAGLALAIALAHDVLRRRKSVRSEEEQIALRYHCIVVPVFGLDAPGPERITVAGFANLAGLAQYLERPILYETSGDERIFAVDDEHRRYLYSSTPGSPAMVEHEPSGENSARPPLEPNSRRRHHRSRKANLARGAAGVVVLGVAATLMTSFTATTTVPTSSAGSSAHARTISQLAPTGCNSLTLTALVHGSGTFSNSTSNALILGSVSSDTITDTGSGDCIIGGGGTNTIDGTSTDIGVSGPTLAIAAPCPVAPIFAGITYTNTSNSTSTCSGAFPPTGVTDVDTFPGAICSSSGNAPSGTYSWHIELANGTPGAATAVNNTGPAITVTATVIKATGAAALSGGSGTTETIANNVAATGSAFQVTGIGQGDYIQIHCVVTVNSTSYAMEIQVG